MTDVVTGANGYLGNVLVKELLKRNRRVRVLVRSTSNLDSLKNLDVEKYTGDISDIDSLYKAFKGADAIYHLAGKISLMPGQNNILHNINYLGTKNVIQACKVCKINRLIYTSSIHSLKEPSGKKFIDEYTPYCTDNNKNAYDISKARASIDVLKAVKEGLDAVIVNPTGVIGPYDYAVSALTKTFIDFAKKRLKFAIEGAYDFVDVRDVAIGHILAYEKGKSGSNYILSGERVTVARLMQILEKITGIKAPNHCLSISIGKFIGSIMPIYYWSTGTRPYFTRYSVEVLCSNSFISHEKTTKDLGYNPRSVTESIRDTIKWLKNMGYI
ncbi:MAG: NAD-dependent epimerase/dehydratase family protein [Actinomycetota bacterium]|nr:NAD-dependent epimerase/dehydratase family protein [Actinomycetota bacterium]